MVVFFPNLVSYDVFEYFGNNDVNILFTGDIPIILLVFVELNTLLVIIGVYSRIL